MTSPLPYGLGVVAIRILLALLELRLFCVARGLARATRIEYDSNRSRIRIDSVVQGDVRILQRHQSHLAKVMRAVTGSDVAVEIRALSLDSMFQAPDGSAEMPSDFHLDAYGRSVWASSPDDLFVAFPAAHPELTNIWHLYTAVPQPYEELFDEQINDDLCDCLRCAERLADPRILIVSGSEKYAGSRSCMGSDLEPLKATTHHWWSVNMTNLVDAGGRIGDDLARQVEEMQANVVVIARGGNLAPEDVEEFRRKTHPVLAELADNGIEIHVALGHANACVCLPMVSEHTTPTVLADRLVRRLGLPPRRGRVAVPMTLRERDVNPRAS